jgi:hypothetical protein
VSQFEFTGVLFRGIAFWWWMSKYSAAACPASEPTMSINQIPDRKPVRANIKPNRVHGPQAYYGPMNLPLTDRALS